MNNAKKKALALILIALAVVLLVGALLLYIGGGLSSGAPSGSNNPSGETTGSSAEDDSSTRPTTTRPTFPELTDDNSLNLNNMQVVLPESPTDVETNAAQELVDYVAKMTGTTIPVVKEGEAVEAGIYVGNTKFAQDQKVTYPTTEYGEGWAIKAIDGNLVLCGESVRGTLYAVYHLLEDCLGIHWWTYTDEYVPTAEAALIWNEYSDSGSPAFKYRDMHPGALNSTENLFHVRNRLNGHDAAPPAGFGGTENYGSPAYVHTFNLYVPDNMFGEHPDWFSMVDGQRVNNSQLCLSNKELLQYMIDKLAVYIEYDAQNCEQAGIALPRWYSIVPADWDKFCECEECATVIEKSGLSGYLLKFVNAIAETYPDISFDTLAYWQYKEVPLDDTKPADNVYIRFADNGMDVYHSIDHQTNKTTYELLKGWKDLVKEGQYFFWDYLTTYANAGPATWMYKLPDHFHALLDAGVTGYFGEMENPINTDFWDMKMWLGAKMLEDPYQDFNALVDTFLNGYYGEAGPYIRQYLDMAESNLADYPVHVTFGTPANKPKWLALEDIIAAEEYFNQAAAAVKGNKDLSIRVRAARLSLDRAILERFDYYTREAEKQGISFKIKELEVCQRLVDTIHEQIELRGTTDYTVTGGVNDSGWVARYENWLEKLLNK